MAQEVYGVKNGIPVSACVSLLPRSSSMLALINADFFGFWGVECWHLRLLVLIGADCYM